MDRLTKLEKYYILLDKWMTNRQKSLRTSVADSIKWQRYIMWLQKEINQLEGLS